MQFQENQETAKIIKCNRPNCGLCKHLITGQSCSFKGGKSFNSLSALETKIANFANNLDPEELAHMSHLI